MAPTPSTTAARAANAQKADIKIPLRDLVLSTLEDAKAEDTIAIDITGKSSLSDHMVVTSGRSARHVSAIADQLVKALKDAGYEKPRIEGLPAADWVLVDASDVIVHIFRPEVREFYNIEKMWAAEFGADAH
ncbi:ribosome silencing factor [Pelagibacterium xiamenense]|uniref:ribosome silencing factor n=1 Tax=Pelagibacterium xiamenense TaxID=2901140 RepID=UPI001E3ED4AB|nr:ribosome silencing factor [Pelagibacterium xiamenense]MCD7061446.1 ribosome silencing factor [Pelagibacterium xiamenense]